MRKGNKDLIMLLQIMNIPDLAGRISDLPTLYCFCKQNKEVVQFCPQSATGIKSLEATYIIYHRRIFKLSKYFCFNKLNSGLKESWK